MKEQIDVGVRGFSDSENGAKCGIKGDTYLKTSEAAQYLRKSVSWLLRQADIAYLPGNPNTYRRCDLDAWFERHKFKPRAA